MRALKFRAWFPKDHWVTGEKRMVYNYADLQIFENFGFYSEEIEYMQFTGLIDKNIKEIYEGDIVKVLAGGKQTKKNLFIIVFDLGCFSLKPIGYEEFTTIGHYFYGCVENGIFKSYKKCNGSVFEVIGNIHENPELL